jgi:SAM-dependent methyltransferase
MNYRIAYAVGFHPWEDAAEHAPFTEKIAELFAAEENGGGPTPGTALDIGTGSGIWGIRLAKRGWRVIGVDNVERALDRAREQVAEAGVEMSLVNADVTDLTAAAVGSGHRLVLDTGTFHGLGPDEREAMGRGVDAVAADDATVLLLAWEPRRRGPLPRGASPEEIGRAFPGWDVADAGPSHFQAPKPIEVLFRPAERWYRLRRR